MKQKPCSPVRTSPTPDTAKTQRLPLSVKPIPIPPVIRMALERGAILAPSLSGGKDSHAMLRQIAHHPERHHWTGRILALHADLGRAEWHQTPEFVERICHEEGIPLEIVRRPQGDLFDRIEEELSRENRTTNIFWPSSKARYCTAELKRDQLVKAQRRFPLVISAQGLRAAESTGRAKVAPIKIEKRASTKPLKDFALPATSSAEDHEAAAQKALDAWRPGGARLVINWLPIHDMDTSEVWRSCGTSKEELALRRLAWQAGYAEDALRDWPAHPAYVIGTFHENRWHHNERLSCALCVLACRGDLINGAHNNPAAFRFLVEIEERTGIRFIQGITLRELAPELLQEDPEVQIPELLV